MHPSLSTPTDPGLQNLIELAIADLAARLAFTPSNILLLEAKSVTWSNSSLGCQQPGRAYAQILTPGYMILLKASDKIYEYHTNRGTRVILCENPSVPISGMPSDR